MVAGGSIVPTQAQDAPRLIFASDRAPDYYPEVYSLDLAGGVRKNVSLDEHSDQLAAVRGSQVVFASDRLGQALYTAPLGSSGAARRFTNLPSHSLLEGAAWSPNGAELAVTFGSTLNIEYSTELVDRSGRKLVQLQHAAAALPLGSSPWSADGTRLVYRFSGLHQPRPMIKVVDGRGRLQFSRPGGSALWAPAAPRLAVVTEGGDTDKGSTIVTDEQGRTLRHFSGVALAFSPDGKTLVLVRRPQALWLASVETGKLRRLPGGEPGAAAVSPDGRHLEVRFDSSPAILIVSMSSARVEAHLPAFGAWLADSRRLAFVNPSTPNFVTLVAVDGRVLRRVRLGPDGETVGALTVTRDGTAVVYTAQSAHVHQIYERLPSGELRQITTGLVDHSGPASSPDGRMIADSEFSTPCGNCVPVGIGVLAADGSKPAQQLDEGNIDTHPTWSPDGLHIAYSQADPTGNRIVAVRPDGSQSVELAEGSDGREPSWSPDGSAIAAARNGIFVMASDGTGARQLTGALPAGSDASQTHAPAWSPDSAMLAFAGADGLYLIGRNGSGLHRILAVSGVAAVTWSPDGALIAFAVLCAKCTGSETHDIWTVRPDGSGLTIVVDDIADDTTPAWLPAGS